MALLPEDKLIWSPTVANNRMNRSRKASGVNSYEQEFGFKPELYLLEKIREKGHAHWLDLCCGEGHALVQTARYFHERGLQDKISLTGIDLLDSFAPVDEGLRCLQWQVGSLVDLQLNGRYDLITCSHGLYYVGDKLKALQLAVGTLVDNGLLIAHLDLNNIVVEGAPSNDHLSHLLQREQLSYNKKKKLLQRVGGKAVNFGLFYQGADDQAGPNYTGQDVVNSYNHGRFIFTYTI